MVHRQYKRDKIGRFAETNSSKTGQVDQIKRKLSESPAFRKRLSLPDVPVETVHLRLARDNKAIKAEFERFGLTEDNSKVRRLLNSARSSDDHLMMIRDSTGKPVAGLLVDRVTSGRGSYRSTEHTVHELFKDAGAPSHSGTLLMVKAAQAAKEAGAELRVSGALNTARSFYESLGGDFGTSSSSSASWTNAARDALAAGSPIPARHS